MFCMIGFLFSIVSAKNVETTRTSMYSSQVEKDVWYDFYLDFEHDSDFLSVKDSIVWVKFDTTGSTRLDLLVDNHQCSPSSYTVSDKTIDADAYFDCSQWITKPDTYRISIRADSKSYNVIPSLEVKYFTFTGNVKVMGTDYFVWENGTVFLQLLDDNSEPLNNATCVMDLYYPDKTVFVDKGAMTLLENGLYYYDFLAQNETGVYMLSVKCSYYYSQSNYTANSYNTTYGFENCWGVDYLCDICTNQTYDVENYYEDVGCSGSCPIAGSFYFPRDECFVNGSSTCYNFTTPISKNTTCSQAGACSFTCSGTCTDCSTFTTQSTCLAQSGCGWTKTGIQDGSVETADTHYRERGDNQGGNLTDIQSSNNNRLESSEQSGTFPDIIEHFNFTNIPNWNETDTIQIRLEYQLEYFFLLFWSSSDEDFYMYIFDYDAGSWYQIPQIIQGSTGDTNWYYNLTNAQKYIQDGTVAVKIQDSEDDSSNDYLRIDYLEVRTWINDYSCGGSCDTCSGFGNQTGCESQDGCSWTENGWYWTLSNPVSGFENEQECTFYQTGNVNGTQENDGNYTKFIEDENDLLEIEFEFLDGNITDETEQIEIYFNGKWCEGDCSTLEDEMVSIWVYCYVNESWSYLPNQIYSSYSDIDVNNVLSCEDINPLNFVNNSITRIKITQNGTNTKKGVLNMDSFKLVVLNGVFQYTNEIRGGGEVHISDLPIEMNVSFTQIIEYLQNSTANATADTRWLEDLVISQAGVSAQGDLISPIGLPTTGIAFAEQSVGELPRIVNYSCIDDNTLEAFSILQICREEESGTECRNLTQRTTAICSHGCYQGACLPSEENGWIFIIFILVLIALFVGAVYRLSKR